ncbi:MAG TPA: cell division protein [Stellaceae bacterium]|nr:cell division protein [Stellaceae bacterium]
MIGRIGDDIPLRRDGTVRLLPWLIAPMVYLAALALAGMLALNGVLQSWDRGLSGTMTVELPAAPAPPATDDAVGKTLRLLRATPGIVSATPLERNAEVRLIEPWLGSTIAPEELQLPRLVDLRITSGAAIDLPALRAKLVAAVPGAVLDDHRLWLDRLYGLAISVEATGFAIFVMVGVAAVLTVIFTTRAGLAVHHDVIELLHLMGARDLYIARQFESEALRMGLSGGIGGIALAALTLWGLGHAAAATAVLGEEAKLLPDLSLVLWQWAALAVLPVLAGLAALVTARFTVMRALARMP